LFYLVLCEFLGVTPLLVDTQGLMNAPIINEPAENGMKVLVADYDPTSRLLLESSLKTAGYTVIGTANGVEALQLLQRHDGPRLAVLEWMMSGMDGLEVCRAIRTTCGERYIYLIVLTSKSGQQDIVKGFEAGADDYVIKPCDLTELKARVRTGKRILELQEQLVVARECLRLQASHDSLTGLYNRMAILEILEKELSRFLRDGFPVSVTMVDLDYFKRINDTWGHPAGDVVLREIGKRMRSVIRTYDAAARFGGEEFLLVASGTDLLGAEKQAERVRYSICSEPVEFGDALIPITVSMGVAEASHGLQKADDLLRAADGALYLAKNQGRNRVVSTSGMNISSRPSPESLLA
jgi:diguanylate cyclase (GGDEF)-like protein